MRGVKLVTYLAAKLFGGEVSVRQLAEGASLWERWVLFNADLGPVDAVTAAKGRGRSEQN